MQLYLVRHGLAVASDEWTGAERDRPLTPAGRDEMRLAARGLRKLAVAPNAIYTSPFARARETAELIADELHVPLEDLDALSPGAQLNALAGPLARHRDAGALLFAGHEPDLSAMIGQLIGILGTARVEMKKGACCRVDLFEPPPTPLNLAQWEVRGTLIWLLTGKQLARLGS
jgi:phosphohistidine phosphatase